MWRAVKHSKVATQVQKGFIRVRDDIRRKPSMALIALVAGAAASFLFGIPVAAIWTLFILFLVYDWNMIVPIICGAFSFALCVYFALIGKQALAEAAIVYSYFFFGIAAILWFVRYGYKLV